MHTLISAPKPDRDSSACSPPGRTCSAALSSSLSRRPCHDQKAGCKPSAQTSASIMMIASQPFLDAFGDATAHNGYSARGVHPGWHPVDARGIGDLSLYLRPFGDPSESPKVARHGYAEEGRHPTDRSRSDHRMAAGLAVQARSKAQPYLRPYGSRLTCTDFKPYKERSLDSLLSCRRSSAYLQDRNMALTCRNVELRGLEPLASCMPCKRSTN